MSPLDKQPNDWLEHSFTTKLRKHIERQQELALAGLLSAARKSTDPTVTKHFATYDEIGSFLRQLGKVNADGSGDDGDQ